MAFTRDIEKGLVIMFNGEPHLIMEREFYKPGKGNALHKCRLRGLKTGKMINHTYRSGEEVETIDVETKTVVFTYVDGENGIFMDPKTFEMVEIPIQMIPGGTDYLLVEAKYILMTFEESPLSIQVPPKISLIVTDTADGGDKGDTSGNATKEATLETGITVQVPLFIKKGDKIIVNTETGQYFARDNS